MSSNAHYFKYANSVVYLFLVANLNKPIDIVLLKEANDYFNTLPEKIQSKFLKSFDKTRIALKGKWFKNIGNDI